MVRLSLEACIPNLVSPTDIYASGKNNVLLAKKGTPLTDRIKEILRQHHIHYLDFPLPYESIEPPPYTFSEETETALFCLVLKTYQAFKKDAVANPLGIRKEAYDLLERAFKEFRIVTRMENPTDNTLQKRTLQSVLHLRTVGSLEDSLFEHVKNVSLLCVVMAFDFFRESKHRLAEIHKTGIAALFSDIGMMKIPSRIVQKNEPLTPDEMEVVKKHPEISARFMETLFHQKDFAAIHTVRCHHERCDGSGYTAQFTKNELNPYALILHVADSYTSMISKRYFRPARNPIDAILELNERAGHSYDEKAVKCLNYRVAPYPIGSVAHFAGDRLVQVTELDRIPIDFDELRIIDKSAQGVSYNCPKSIHAFKSDGSSKNLKSISIHGHEDKMGIPVDTYDLLVLYRFTK